MVVSMTGLSLCVLSKPSTFDRTLGASAVRFPRSRIQPHFNEVNGISRVVYDISGKPPAPLSGSDFDPCTMNEQNPLLLRGFFIFKNYRLEVTYID